MPPPPLPIELNTSSNEEEEAALPWHGPVQLPHEEEEERDVHQMNQAAIGSEMARRDFVVVDYSNDETYLSDEDTDDEDPFA
jgi:hypothetical protein